MFLHVSRGTHYLPVTKELFNSEKYKSYLSTMSKFHNYSVNNTLLIALLYRAGMTDKTMEYTRQIGGHSKASCAGGIFRQSYVEYSPCDVVSF